MRTGSSMGCEVGEHLTENFPKIGLYVDFGAKCSGYHDIQDTLVQFRR